MKKRNLKSLKFEKRTISKIDNYIFGGDNDSDITDVSCNTTSIALSIGVLCNLPTNGCTAASACCTQQQH